VTRNLVLQAACKSLDLFLHSGFFPGSDKNILQSAWDIICNAIENQVQSFYPIPERVMQDLLPNVSFLRLLYFIIHCH
jgi:hypothetical protein